MNNSNNKFEVGDEVIALKSNTGNGSQPRTKGDIYIVKAVSYCSINGRQAINVGPTTNRVNLKCDCGRSHPTDGLHWTFSSLFIKREDLEAKMDEAVEEEDYELASTLRDLI